jgi:hypothetical protein
MKNAFCCSSFSLMLVLVATALLLFVLEPVRAYNPEKYGAIGWQVILLISYN